MKLFVAFLSLFIGQVSQAVHPEILWFKMERNFTYKDIDKYCGSKLSPTRFLMSVETVDGVVRNAAFKQNNNPYSKKICFAPSELSGIEIKADASKRKWVSSLKLNARLLNWIFMHSDDSGCTPSQSLATLGPNEFEYLFDLNNVLAHPVEVISNQGHFYGQRKDGKYYQASLALTQISLP